VRVAAIAVVAAAAAVGAVAACGAGSDGSTPTSSSPSSNISAPTTSSDPTTSSSVPTLSPAARAGPSPGCASSGDRVPPERIDLTVDGVARTALVHIPPAGSAPPGPLPVVLSFHGVSGNAALQRSTDGLLELADEHGFVAVHAEGLLVGLNDRVTGITGWDPDASVVDDVAYVAALIDSLGVATCIDTGRVTATGFSAGGNMALAAACALPERISAVAPVGAAYQPDACGSGPPLPILAFHGTDDVVVPLEGRDDGAGRLLPVRQVLEEQARRNGCSGEVTTTDLSPRVRSLQWSDCEAPTALIELDEHGHAWPGRPMPFDRQVLVSVFAGSATTPPDPLMIAIGEQPDTMADNVLLTNVDVDASERIREFFAGLP
jgi:polyhydroxybutyrate depolymerase